MRGGRSGTHAADTLLALAALALSGCRSPPLVEHQGALRDMFSSGDVAGRVALAPLLARPHLYALGPLDGLRGEILVWDGVPSVSRVVDRQVEVTVEPDAAAVFLVWSWVERWQEVELTRKNVELEALDSLLPAAAVRAGLDPTQPFPFVLIGTAEQAVFHVVELPPDAGPLTRERHDAAKRTFTLVNAPVEVLGFHSTQHAGVFTHHTTHVHCHLKTRGGGLAGHVDALRLAPGVRLLLPEVRK